MGLELIVAWMTGFVVLCYVYLTWNYNYWKKRGIPQLSNQIPGIGDLKDVVLQRISLDHKLIEMYKKFVGYKVCGFYKFRQPALLVRDPKLMKTVLVTDFSSFHDNDIYVNEKTNPIMSKHPFAARGAKWKSIRTQLSPSFTTAKFRSLFPLVKENYKYLNKYINDHIGENVEAKQLVSLFAVDNVASVAYGVEGGSFNKDTQELYKHGMKMMGQFLNNPVMMFILLYFPKVMSLLELLGLVRTFPQESIEYFETLIKETEKYRQKNNIIKNDFLQALLNLRKEAEKNGQDYSYDDIIAHCLTFFIDGFESSSTMTSFALYELAVNPDIQEKLRDEFKRATPEGAEIEFDKLSSLPYLDQIISETLRKYSVFSVSKLCTKNTTLEVDGKHIPIEKGTNVLLSLYALHNDPEYFENPDVFDPERFSKDNVTLRSPDVHLPFGSGPRFCLGQKFALLQMKSFIYNVISNYRVLRCEKTVDTVVFDKLYILPKCVDGLWIKMDNL